LGRLVRNPEALALLNASPQILDQRRIKRLFTLIEDVVAAEYEGSTRYTTSLSARYIFQLFPLPLGDGHGVKSCGFKTRFQAPLRNRGRHHTRVGETEEATAPLRSIEFDTLQSLKANTNAKLVERKAPILQLCLEVLESHEQVVAQLRLAQESGLDGLPAPMRRRLLAGFAPERKPFLGLGQQAKLQVALFLWGITGSLAVAKPYEDIASSSRLRHKKWRNSRTVWLSDVPLPNSLALGEDFEARREVLLSHICPTRKVAFICLVSLMAETGLNKQTLKGTKFRDIEPLSQGYRLRGVKLKTDQIQTRDVFSSVPELGDDNGFTVVSPLAVKALKVLLNASAESPTDPQIPERAPLFRVLRLRLKGGSNQFKLLIESGVHSKLRRDNSLWSFQLRSLRNLALQIHYTSPSGDVFSTAALAGHGSIDVTAQYLEETIISWMHESNINKFMKMLGATILWVVGREAKVEEHELKEHVSKRLLFPLTGMAPQPRSSAVDDWISSMGTTSLTIGIDEIHHTAFQHNFYKRNLRDLAHANPTAFVKHHLPRAVVCEALRQLILASPHKGLLRAFEEAIHETHTGE
jgi:hypothetical protein